MRAFIPILIVLIIVFAASRRRRSAGLPNAAATGTAGSVEVDDTGLTLRRTDGGADGMTWEELRHISIETVAGGLNASEVMWVLTANDGASVRVAQTAPGADRLIARLQQLPGFRYEPMIQSMITTDATRFVVWERPAA